MFKVNNISEVRDVDALYCIKTATDTEFSIVVTDAFGAIVNLKDLQTPAGIQGIASDDGTIEVTGTTFKNIRLSATLVNAINSALKPGDNISELVNDAGYLTSFTEIDPIFQASEASNFVSGDKANLDNQSGVNTGDETSTSIQSKRPLKTVDNKSLEGTGNIEIDYNTVINKPTEFPPSTHTHTISEVINLQNELNSKENISNKVNTISGNSSVDYTTEKAVVDYVSSELNLLKNPDRITENTGFTLVGQDITMNSLWKGVISGVEYSNPTSQVINLPLSTVANTRADIIVLTKNNNFIRVQGVESTTNPPIPSVPNDTLLAVTVIVNDSSVGNITNPISGDEYVKKIEFGNVLLTGSGVINQLNLVDEKATIVFKDAITRLNTISYASVPYNGKRITLFNAQATPVTIGNAVSGFGIDFIFPDGQDYVLQPNQTIEFSYDLTYLPYAHHMFIGLKVGKIFLAWKTPQDYGAVGDGFVDDSDAFIACLAAENNILLFGTYKVSKDLPLRDNQFIFSNNAVITRNSTTGDNSLNAIIKAQSINNFSIRGNLTIVGSGSTNTGQIGIFLQASGGFKIDGVTVKKVAGSGIEFSGFVAKRGDGGFLNNISLQDNYYGAYYNVAAEYYTMSNVNAAGNNTALYILGGNNTIIGGSISDNTNGIYIGETFGNNNSHGILQGLNVNHNTGYNLKAENVEFGESIVGCHFYADSGSGIAIINSKGLLFEGCSIDGNVTNSDSNAIKGYNMFSNCLFESSFSYSGDVLYFKNCFTKTKGQITDNNYDVKGLNQAIGVGYNNLGNINIYTDDDFAVNKGGTLSLGGKYHTGLNDVVSFAKIHGKKENAIAGDLCGYLVFEISNNTTAPYSREVARLTSDGKLIMNTTEDDNSGALIQINGGISSKKLKATDLPIYSNNSAAITGGLLVGDFYRTSTGELRVRF